MSLICILHFLAMFDVEMNLSNFVYYIQVVEMLLFIHVIFEYGCFLSSIPVIFRIVSFNLFKCGRSMSLIPLILQQNLDYAIPTHKVT